jgi:hypothetical protein
MDHLAMLHHKLPIYIRIVRVSLVGGTSCSYINYIFPSLSMAYSPSGLNCLFSFLILYTVRRTPWAGDQHVARPLPTHRITQTQNKHR